MSSSLGPFTTCTSRSVPICLGMVVITSSTPSVSLRSDQKALKYAKKLSRLSVCFSITDYEKCRRLRDESSTYADAIYHNHTCLYTGEQLEMIWENLASVHLRMDLAICVIYLRNLCFRKRITNVIFLRT